LAEAMPDRAAIRQLQEVVEVGTSIGDKIEGSQVLHCCAANT